MTSSQLASSLDTSEDWIVERTGIRKRHVGGTTADLAVDAGLIALAKAGVQPGAIDALILATTTPERLVPATASIVQDGLGLSCGALDLNAACSGFVYGLIVAYGLLSVGASRILLIGSDTMTTLTNWNDRDTAILFGDGAGAVVLEASVAGGELLGWHFDSDGSARDLLYAEHGSHLKMNGKEVFRRAVRMMADSAERAMAAAGVDVSQVSLMVTHQANHRITLSLCDRLGISIDRAVSVVHRTGNTSSASVPIALADALDTGRVSRNDLVRFAGFGAGMSSAAALVRW